MKNKGRREDPPFIPQKARDGAEFAQPEKDGAPFESRGKPVSSVGTKGGRPRAGFVAIIGRPNAGKSTLLNRYVGQKVAIVTSKPQTTRNRIQGIVTRAEGQIVFIDTPGLHNPDTVLNKQMMREVSAALEGIDLLLMMVDASRTLPHADSVFRRRGPSI